MCLISWFQILTIYTSHVSVLLHPSSCTAERWSTGCSKVKCNRTGNYGSVWKWGTQVPLNMPSSLIFLTNPNITLLVNAGYRYKLHMISYSLSIYIRIYIIYIYTYIYICPVSRVYKKNKHQLAVWVHRVHRSIPSCWPNKETSRGPSGHRWPCHRSALWRPPAMSIMSQPKVQPKVGVFWARCLASLLTRELGRDCWQQLNPRESRCDMLWHSWVPKLGWQIFGGSTGQVWPSGLVDLPIKLMEAVPSPIIRNLKAGKRGHVALTQRQHQCLRPKPKWYFGYLDPSYRVQRPCIPFQKSHQQQHPS